MTAEPGSVDVVTGAFGYSGAAIATQLQAAGRRVRTVTGHPGRAPAGTAIDVRPLNFHRPAELARSMQGAHTLYNTYWVRFAYGSVDHDMAVVNSRILFDAAVAAGIQRIVHISITNPSLDSPYSYFRGKAHVEQILAGTGVSYAIVRPGILFGRGGVLINNMAWLLRHLPVFAVGGRGAYQIRGIHIDDLARLCVRLGAGTDTVTMDAVGPQSLTFSQLVSALRTAVASHSIVMPLPGPVVVGLSQVLGLVLRDALLTRAEYQAMVDGLVDSNAPATGTIGMADWIADHGPEHGHRYANELDRHFR